jgi:hypothetical protein
VKPLPVLALVLVLVGCGATTGDQRQAGDGVVLPVVFTDGTEAEVVYPADLDIAGLPVHPYSSGKLNGKSPNSLRGDVVSRDFWIQRAKVHDVLVGANKGKEPRLVAEYRGANEQLVGLWDIRTEPDFLGFQFGSWAVLVYDYTDAAAMTEAERASWAASFSGRETKDGYLLLEGSGSLRLARAGEDAGPELEFGESAEGKGLALMPGKCRQRVDRGPGQATWCVSPSMRAQAVGSEGFVEALLADLRVRDLRVGE